MLVRRVWGRRARTTSPQAFGPSPFLAAARGTDTSALETSLPSYRKRRGEMHLNTAAMARRSMSAAIPLELVPAEAPEAPSLDLQEQTVTVRTVFDSRTCRRRGFCPVPVEAGKEPHQIYYELHGSESRDATKLVFVMGLNASSFAWLKQVEYFASVPQYSVLVFDNRGSGNSSSPRGLYGTPDMARDAVALLDFIGWTGSRSLTIIGASLGGMISMDMAQLIPDRIATLVLSSTKSGYRYNYPTLRTLVVMLRYLTGTVWSERASLRLTIGLMFPREFRNKRDEIAGVKIRDVLEQDFARRINMCQKAPSRGRIGQLAAVLMTAEDLREIAARIPKIALITGTDDKIVRLRDCNILHSLLPGSEYTVCSGVGHGLTLQIPAEFNEWLTRVIDEGQRLIRGEGTISKPARPRELNVVERRHT